MLSVEEKKKKALVIDDSEIVRRILRSIIEKMGFEVLEAADGLEAIDQSIREDISLFIVDINMPNMDGLSFIRKIRKTEKYKKSPIVIVSTEASNKDIEIGIQAGADLYFTKPVDIKRFVEEVSKLIKKTSPKINLKN